MKRHFLLTGEWIETDNIPRELRPAESDWRENPFWKNNEKDVDPSEIDDWNERRLGKMTGAMDRIHTQLDMHPLTCRRLCRYFQIFSENIVAVEWYLKKDPIARLLYLRKMGPVIAHARHEAFVAGKRKDVDALYDFLVASGIDPV